MLLSVNDLKTYFYLDGREIRAVDGVGFELKKGQTMALVGESGCGKTVTALSLCRLIPSPPGRIISGRVIFEGQDILKLPLSSLPQIRGNRISYIFQEPGASLNPVFTIGNQIMETIMLHQKKRPLEARKEAIRMLEIVGIPLAGERLTAYPHQLSGGMKQRAMIAIALSCSPALLIADEPTTALDVTIQAQILDLLLKIKQDTGIAILIITHDLSLVRVFAQKLAIMYAGRIVEMAGADEIYSRPAHPYTTRLLDCVPVFGQVQKRLNVIPGTVPDLSRLPAGCKFSTRCWKADEQCRQAEPDLSEPEPGHQVRCYYPENK